VKFVYIFGFVIKKLYRIFLWSLDLGTIVIIIMK